MSIFDFPRINFKGLLHINVGTANNDDYSGAVFPPDSHFAGQPLRLSDSVAVQPLTFGLSDDAFIAWVQKRQSFQKPNPQPPPCPDDEAASTGPRPGSITRAEREGTRAHLPPPAQASAPLVDVKYVPAEWNFYGDMGLTFQDMKVVGVEEAPGVLHTRPGSDALIGAELSFKNRPGDTGRSTGMIIDVNAEDVPNSQVFTDSLLVEHNGQALLQGKGSKAVTRWINFQRNVNLRGSNGASGTFQCVVPLQELRASHSSLLQRMPTNSPDGRPLAGIVFRYVMFRALQPINTFKYTDADWMDAIEKLYARKGLNPDIAEVVGTLAPWFEGDMASIPAGRLLTAVGKGFSIGPNHKGNADPCGRFRLAPAMVHVDYASRQVFLDLSTCLPDEYKGQPAYDPTQTGNNPKFDFGALSLQVRNGPYNKELGVISYQDTAAGDARGWILAFTYPPELGSFIQNGQFFLLDAHNAELMVEQDYFIASDQACLYTEQGGTGSTANRFISEDGQPVAATVRVFQRGVELTREKCPPLTVWEYDTSPNQDKHVRRRLREGFLPGDALEVSTERAGNRLYTFTFGGQEPPEEYTQLDLSVVPMISLRLLPNDTDYSAYYQNPGASEPVGNATLTFDVIYREVLRNYYLLYPGMNLRIPLNDATQWTDPDMATRLLQRTQTDWWGKSEYMPRTRDLSRSRRELLQAWARRVRQQGGA